jgi:hypothetical protein
MTRLKSQITNPKSQINSKIQIQITKTQKSPPSPGACLREAASAKAGEGMEGRGMVRQAHHNHPEPVEGSPSPLPCGVSFTTPQGGPSPLRARGLSLRGMSPSGAEPEPEATKGEGEIS